MPSVANLSTVSYREWPVAKYNPKVMVSDVALVGPSHVVATSTAGAACETSGSGMAHSAKSNTLAKSLGSPTLPGGPPSSGPTVVVPKVTTNKKHFEKYFDVLPDSLEAK